VSRPKIVVIGGGSHQWVPTLVSDAAATPSVAGAHLALVDIDAARLPRLARWVDHVATARGVGLTASTHTDRREALRGADFVIVCISTGGLDTMAVDLAVPERYGFRQPVGDTVGPGGISRALRNVPVMAAIAADVAELAPDAWIVNITNPMTVLTRTISLTTDVRAVGLCHEVEIARFWLSLLLDCSSHELAPAIVGVNHLPVAVELARTGGPGASPEAPTDALAELRSLVDDPAALDVELPSWVGDLFRDELLLPGAIGTGTWDPDEPFTKRALVGFNGAKFDQLRRTGVLPLAGDRHTVEFFADYLVESTRWGADHGVGLTTIEQRRAQEARYVADLEARLARPEVDRHVSMESAMPLIDSLLGGPARTVPVDVPNDGSLVDLPLDAVIETMGVVGEPGADGRPGIRPERRLAAPPEVAEHLRRLVAAQELTVRAALAGDRDLVVEALATDPLAGRIDRGRLAAMADELIDGNAAFLRFRPGRAPRT
jgi:alpha-galactosidase